VPVSGPAAASWPLVTFPTPRPSLRVMRPFHAMAAQWRDRIFTFAFYSLGSREEAEDVTQEVLVRLWQHWHMLTGAHVTPWVIRVTRNACIDVHRQRRTRQTLLAERGADEPIVRPGPLGPDPEADCERHDFQRRVEQALREVDEPYRTIIILREIDGLPYGEIATAVALPLNTVKVYLHRGRRRLRELLKEEVVYEHC
jgi:RNA polymerase sigma factor (sigma-70 family)